MAQPVKIQTVITAIISQSSKTRCDVSVPVLVVASLNVQKLPLVIKWIRANLVQQVRTQVFQTCTAPVPALAAYQAQSPLIQAQLRASPAPQDGAAHLVAPAAHQQSPFSRAPFHSLPFNSDPSRPSISSSFTLDRTQSRGTLIPPRCHHGSTSTRSLGLSLEAIR